ncbi:MAG TPA: hypothetical protein VM735_12230 [Candidatus Kapabacteria bacterium]|nr:hypothetical protein [Candidatus Kapabacteria bacterium]
MERVIGLIASATRGHTKCIVFCGGEGNPYDRAAAKELYSHTSTCITGNADE